MKKFISSLVLVLSLVSLLFSQTTTYEVGLSGNAYVTSFREGAVVTPEGLAMWQDGQAVIDTYVFFHQPQTLSLSIKGRAGSESEIEVTFLGKKTVLTLRKGDFEIEVGTYLVEKRGYQPIQLQGKSKTGTEFAEIESFIIRTADKITYVRDFSDYWGRRGPSVHLRYTMPREDVEWFYNEVTVPEGNDVIGSYYMANGFGEGYFGMQRNSATERRVLFSVWSPFETQDPTLIPDSMKIRLLRKGEGVQIGEFGNEGSGGQSFLRYDWKAATTYRFLTQIKPDGLGNTVYTSYFYATDEGRWRLIASFLRPQTNVYYTQAYSFLENFIPGQGFLTRKVLFGNQWFKTTAGVWKESVESFFTFDDTARKKVRLDFRGGIDEESNLFYLQNCGFFDESTPFDSRFVRKSADQAPLIDLDQLEAL